MNVVYSASELYAPLAGISLTSVLENNRWAEELNVYVMDNGIGAENKEKLISLTKRYGRSLCFCSLPRSLPDSGVGTGRWNISTFGRLFEGSALPEPVGKVIHIDCDTVVDGSLEPLWGCDMAGKAVAGAVDCLSDRYKRMIGLSADDHYLNAGSIVLNLDLIRARGYEEKFLRYIRRHPETLTYADQEVLNAVIPEREKAVVPLRFNSYSILHYFTYEQLRRVRRVNRFCSPEEYREAVEAPVVIHYTACFMEGTRPWIAGDGHPLRDRFEYYRSLSPWRDMEPWEDTRGAGRRLLTGIFAAAPRTLLCAAVGFVHGTVVPWNIRRKKKLREKGREVHGAGQSAARDGRDGPRRDRDPADERVPAYRQGQGPV